MVGVREKLLVWDGLQDVIIFRTERQLYGDKVGELLAETFFFHRRVDVPLDVRAPLLVVDEIHFQVKNALIQVVNSSKT
jgi:hypothetical protein